MNVRKLALEALDRMTRDKSYSNITVDTLIRRESLTGSEKALFCALVYGCTERQITLDYLIDTLSTLPPSKIEPPTRNILRLGLYQLTRMDGIPDHAALNETVALAPTRSRGFVNAILRTFTRKRDTIAYPTESDGFPRCLSVRYSVNEGLCTCLCNEYGAGRAEEILRAFDTPPALTVRVNTQKTTREALLSDLAARGISAAATDNSPFGIRLDGTPEDAGLGDGFCFVQDEASQIAVAALGARPGDTVFDICACPGSKSFGAALDMKNEGKILSFDIHENKLSLVRKTAANLGITILETRARDGRDFDEALQDRADRIICDVPCSGFGVLAKKPEIRYKNPEESRDLPEIQFAILENASRYLKKGGTLVYSTCTILRRENDDVIERFLAGSPDFSLSPFSVGNTCAGDGKITLFPDKNQTDGFFIAVLTRKL